MSLLELHLDRLPSDRLALLQAAIRDAIDRFGETIPVRIVTYASFARREG